MSGKPKTTGKRVAGWGGARPGGGRKPAYMLSDNQVKAMLKKARQRAKKEGKDIDDILLDIIYGVNEAREVVIVTKKGERTELKLNTDVKDALAAIKLFKEFTLPKQTKSEKKIEITENRGPGALLPPLKQDSALEVVK